MRKSTVIIGFVLVLVGIFGLATNGWHMGDDLPTFEKKWDFKSQDLKRLSIKSDYKVDIKFEKSADGTNSIRLDGQGTEKMIEETQATEISSQGLSLDLTQKPKRWFHFFDFGFVRAKEVLVVSLASDSALENLDVKIDSGSMTINGGDSLKLRDTNISIDSGNLTIRDYRSDELSIDIDSGNITAENVTASLSAHGDSGNMKFTGFSGPADISIDSGNVKLYRNDVAETVISADSGNVYVQVPADFAGFYDLKVDSGRINAPESKRKTNDYVKVTADSGNITVEEK